MSDPSDRPSLAPHSVIAGRYRLVEPLAQGGVGAVWLAINVTLGSRVALKVLQKVARSDEAEARLLIEARAAAQIDHPNIVKEKLDSFLPPAERDEG